MLSVDHNHETGKVRGLLCSRCNSAIGLMKENLKCLRNAINYLTHHKNMEKNNILMLEEIFLKIENKEFYLESDETISYYFSVEDKKSGKASVSTFNQLMYLHQQTKL